MLLAGGALVASLATAGPAAAALGGGEAARFTNRPNLQSVTFNGIIGSFTFDVPVQPGPNWVADRDDRFKIGGYQAGVANANLTSTAANISVTDPKTVLVTFAGDPTDAVDFNASTFGAVAEGIVQGLGTFGEINFYDATAITGATGQSGTSGHTTGPDLIAVQIDSDNNRIAYVFDQLVSRSPALVGSRFGFLDVNGTTQESLGAGVSDNIVVAQFAGDPAHDVDNARQALVRENAAFSSETRQPGAGYANVGVPGKNPLTEAPTLTSAVLEPNTGTIVYTFDQNVAAPNDGDFEVLRSNAVRSSATSAIVVGGNQVRATFPQTSAFVEHVVHASVAPGGVVGTNGHPNAETGKAVGGNTGARGTGYTSAPDAIGATFNQPSGQASVLFDSRILTVAGVPLVDPDDFRLISDDGTVIASAAATASVIQGVGPSQARVVLQYTPQQLAVADYIVINGNRVSSAGGGWTTSIGNAAVFGTVTNGLQIPDAQNVRTILDPADITTTFSKGG